MGSKNFKKQMHKSNIETEERIYRRNSEKQEVSLFLYLAAFKLAFKIFS